MPRDSASDSDAQLESLVVEALERVAQGDVGPDTVLAELCAAHPDLAQELERNVAALRAAGMFDPPDADPRDEYPETLGEFRLLERLGRGGMGIVFLAEQPSMGRHVALKLVRPDLLYDGDARGRFRREVYAVARLAHPGIVAVHSVGEERGVPYLAMEYVRGVSLDQLGRSLDQGSDPRPSGAAARTVVAAQVGADIAPTWDEELFALPWTRFVLRVVRDVAEALEHAHGRGVLHRDVKPSNVMLTPEGRVLLLDFGLARAHGTESLTEVGAMLGSLPYMAPEQLEGRAAEIDRRTDVYGLGVTLHELLSLRSPYLDAGRPESTRERILAGRPHALRRYDAHVTREVEAVCAKAMDPDPERRYPSAGAFGADLSNLLEGRPVSAQPTGLGTHVARWARREPRLASALCMLLLAAIAVPLVFLWQQRQANRRIAEELDRSERFADRTEAALQTMTGIALDELVDVPTAFEARQRIVEVAAALYLQQARDRASHPDLAIDAARAFGEAGRLALSLDRPQEALESFEQAMTLLEVHGAGLDGEELRGWARSLASTGRASVDLGRVEAAEALFQRSTEIARQAALLGADADDLRFDLAVSAVERAAGRTAIGEHEAARDLVHGALTDLEELERDSSELRHAVYLGWAWNVLGGIHFARGEVDASLAALVSAAEAYERGLVHHPDSRDLRQQLLSAEYNRSAALNRMGRHAEAADVAAGCVERARSTLEEFPDLPRSRMDLALALNNYAAACMQADHWDEAREALYEAGDLGEEALAEFPDNLEFARQSQTILSQQVKVLNHDGEHEEALDLAALLSERHVEFEARRPGNAAATRTRNLLVLEEIRAWLALGDESAALGALRELRPPDDGEILAECAAQLAAASARGAEGHETLELAERALSLLTRAIQAGYADLDALGRAPLAALAELEGYERVEAALRASR